MNAAPHALIRVPRAARNSRRPAYGRDHLRADGRGVRREAVADFNDTLELLSIECKDTNGATFPGAADDHRQPGPADVHIPQHAADHDDHDHDVAEATTTTTLQGGLADHGIHGPRRVTYYYDLAQRHGDDARRSRQRAPTAPRSPRGRVPHGGAPPGGADRGRSARPNRSSPARCQPRTGGDGRRARRPATSHKQLVEAHQESVERARRASCGASRRTARGATLQKDVRAALAAPVAALCVDLRMLRGK